MGAYINENKIWLAGIILSLLLGAGLLFVRIEADLQNAPRAACQPADLPPAQLSGGETAIGEDRTYREEAPRRTRSVEGFSIDRTEVTNRQFSAFIDATGYVTDAERPQAGFEQAGGAVFSVPSVDNPSWWRFVAGAQWRHPEGPNSSIKGREDEPVVQVSLRDAMAYASWAGRRLPSEIEWEYAARSGGDSLYIWGEEATPNGQYMANSWQGSFPIENTKADGFGLRAPVGCFPANDFGLYDMAGNVWEWTGTKWQDTTAQGARQNVIKGGSFLCAPNFCQRYRAAGRQAQDVDFSTNHLGFRTIAD